MEMKTDKGRAFGKTPEPEEEINENGERPASEDEQLEYDMILARAEKYIFGKGKEQVLKLLGSGETPAQSIGQAAAMVIRLIGQAAKGSGKELRPAAMQEAGMDLVEDLSELGKVAGVFQFADEAEEQEQLEQAVFYGMKYYGEAMQKAGEITPEMQQQAQSQMDQGLAAEQAAAGPPPEEEQPAPKKGMIAGAMSSGV